MSGQLWITVISSFFLVLALAWKEFRRPNRKALIFRLTASLIAVVSLMSLIRPIQIDRKKPANSLVLLTEGFLQTASFKDSVPSEKKQTFVTLDPDIYQSSNSAAIKLVSIHELKSLTKQSADALHVLGWGLEAEELQQMKGVPLRFSSPPPGSGINSISWTKTVHDGAAFRIQGNFVNKGKSAVRIFLVGAGTNLDSLVAPGSAQTEINLRTFPRQTGLAVFALVLVSGKDTIKKEYLPFNLLSKKKSSVLFLAARPSFESRFLKNWLGDNGFPLRIRTRITSGKFEKTFVNLPSSAFDRITPAILDETQLVVADASELREMSKQELSLIRDQVAQKGMGLLVRFDSAASRPSFFEEGFSFNPVQHEKEQLYRPGDSAKLASLPVGLPAAIRPQVENQPILLNEKGEILVASRLFGNGRIVLSLLDYTYTLKLSGNDPAFETLWSIVIGKALTGNSTALQITTDPTIPVVREKLRLTVSGQAESPLIRFDSIRLAAASGIWEKDRWTAVHWPEKPGWSTVYIADSLRQPVYIFPRGAWNEVRQHGRKEATQAQIKASEQGLDSTPAGASSAAKNLPSYLFFLCFMGAMTYLWLENKYASLA